MTNFCFALIFFKPDKIFLISAVKTMTRLRSKNVALPKQKFHLWIFFYKLYLAIKSIYSRGWLAFKWRRVLTQRDTKATRQERGSKCENIPLNQSKHFKTRINLHRTLINLSNLLDWVISAIINRKLTKFWFWLA